MKNFKKNFHQAWKERFKKVKLEVTNYIITNFIRNNSID